MNNRYQTLLSDQLKKQHERIAVRPLKEPIGWASVPETAKPKRKSHPFKSYIWRRKGYLIDTTIADFLALVGRLDLGEEARTKLEERWQRGLYWKPLALPLEELNVEPFAVKAGKPKREDMEIAEFLDKKGVNVMRVQAYHPNEDPANVRCLNFMQEQGLLPRLGGELVQFARVQVTL